MQLGLVMCHMVQLAVPEHDVQTFVRTVSCAILILDSCCPSKHQHLLLAATKPFPSLPEQNVPLRFHRIASPNINININININPFSLWLRAFRLSGARTASTTLLLASPRSSSKRDSTLR